MEVDPRDHPIGVEAARRVKLEIWSVLGEFREALAVVGGSVPPYIVESPAGDPYVGTLDVDVVVDPLGVPDETYRTIAAQLRGRGYEQGDQPFQWYRTIDLGSRPITVEVDLLAPTTDRAGRSHRHERIGGEPIARRTEGAELLRRQSEELVVAGVLPDGRPNEVSIRFATAGVLVVLKALALDQRDKPKDSYDIDYVLAYAPGGPAAVAEQILELMDADPVAKALRILRDKFATVDSYGPSSVARYRRAQLGSEEADRIQALAFARARALLGVVDAASDRGPEPRGGGRRLAHVRARRASPRQSVPYFARAAAAAPGLACAHCSSSVVRSA